MKLTFGALTLHDDTDGTGTACSGFTGSARQVIEKSARIRAAALALFKRGNLSTPVSFEISRPHASLAAALTFGPLHAQAVLAESGELVLQYRTGGGSGGFISWQVAECESVGYRHTGSRTFHQYTFICGACLDQPEE